MTERVFGCVWLFICLWLVVQSSHGVETFSEGMSLIPHSEIIDHDGTGDLTLPHLGFVDGPVWIRINPPQVLSALNGPWFLHIPYYHRNDLQVFVGGEQRWHTGSLQPLSSRAVLDPDYVFPIDVADHGQPIDIRLESIQNMNLPIRAWTPQGFQEHARWRDLAHKSYAGAMVLLVVVHLVLSLVVRNSNYLIYACLTACVATVVLGHNGYMRLYVWPDAIVWDHVADQFVFTSVAIFALLLGKRFLTLSVRYRWLDNLMNIMLIWAISIVLITLYGAVVEGRLIDLYGAGIVMLWLVAILLIIRSVIAFMHGFFSAAYLIVGWFSLWVGISLSAAWAVGFLPSYFWIVHATQIGSVLEAGFLSLALADQILKERRAHGYTQAELVATESLRQKQTRLTEVVSHEFRNPLGIIRNQLVLLKRLGALSDPVMARRLRSIDAASMRLTRLVDQWFTSHRVLDENLSGQYQTIWLAEWLRGQQAYLDSCFPDHVLSFTVRDDAMICGEPDLLATVLFNLVDNACKASGNGAVVDVVLEKRQGLAVLRVVDEGCGVALSEQNRIFDDFYRNDGNNNAHGLGLGLSLVRDVMEKHQGQVQVRSKPLQGAEFILSFPIVVQE